MKVQFKRELSKQCYLELPQASHSVSTPHKFAREINSREKHFAMLYQVYMLEILEFCLLPKTC